MPPRRRKATNPVLVTLRFWGIVFLITGVSAVASFHVAKQVVGGALARADNPKPRPRFAQQFTEEVSSEEPAATSDEPPLRPIIKLEPREPTPLEKTELEEASEETASSETGDSTPAGANVEAAPEGEATPRGAAPPPATRPPAATPRPSGSGPRVYVVRTGSFADEENARAEVRRLAADGYQPYTTSIKVGGQTYYRVNVATFRERTQAGALVKELTHGGYDATVTEEAAER